MKGLLEVIYDFFSESRPCHLNLWEQKVRQKKFWPLGIPELQLAVDPLGWQFEKKFV